MWGAGSRRDQGPRADRSMALSPSSAPVTSIFTRGAWGLPVWVLRSHMTPLLGPWCVHQQRGLWPRVPPLWAMLPMSSTVSPVSQPTLDVSSLMHHQLFGGFSFEGVQSLLKGMQELLEAHRGSSVGSSVGVWGASAPALSGVSSIPPEVAVSNSSPSATGPAPTPAVSGEDICLAS